MFRFIRLWLVLRILQHQEEFIVKNDADAARYYSEGAKLYTGTSGFVDHCSNMRLWHAFLPSFMRSGLKPIRSTEGKIPGPVAARIRDIGSLVREAKSLGYVEGPENDFVALKGDMSVRAGTEMRISPEGDNFVTYFGGLEALLKKFPQSWTFLALPLLPWIVSHFHLISRFRSLFT